MIHVGTCGYSYADWTGEFYPARIRAPDMLSFYARRLSAVEIDATYYRVPSAATFAAMAKRVPAGFRFSVKLPGSATHVAGVARASVHPDVALLRRNIAPLVESGALAAALMQFPNSLRPGVQTRAHIAALRDALPGIALVAEFRHRAWQTNETLAFLRDLGIGWVNVDMPQFETLMRPGADATSPIAYIRFHGRNAATWWTGDNVTRYTYDYRPDELLPWAERIVDLAANPDVREVLAFFNNHARGNAARNALAFAGVLRDRLGGAVAAPELPAAAAEQLALDLGAQTPSTAH